MNPHISKALSLLLDGLRLDSKDRGARLIDIDQDTWIAVIELANAHFLGPALTVALREAGMFTVMPRDVRNYLGFMARQNGKRNQALQTQALKLARKLSRRDITPLFLKGTLALVDESHFDPAGCMMADIDLAVLPGRCDDAIDTLERVGYRISEQYPDGHHAIAKFISPRDLAAVDLHLELIDQRYVLPVAGVWRRARSVTTEDGAATFLVPSATDRVLHTLLHEQIHYCGNFYRGRLRLGTLYDFTRLVAAKGPEIDWASIVRRMREHRLTTPLHSYLLAANSLYGLSWPLAEPPSLKARFHFGRCILQLWFPALQRIGTPWGNLRSAFAWHRMRALYSDRSLGLLHERSLHAWQFLRRFGALQTMKRLFRV